MDMKNIKCVMIIDETLPIGLIANTAAVLGITVGKRFPQLAGADIPDKDGNFHRGITEIPVPVLKGNEQLLRKIRSKLYLPEFAEIETVDFSDIAQGCKTYDEYIIKMKDTEENSLRYLGLGLVGDKKTVGKLTGNLPLLR